MSMSCKVCAILNVLLSVLQRRKCKRKQIVLIPPRLNLVKDNFNIGRVKQTESSMGTHKKLICKGFSFENSCAKDISANESQPMTSCVTFYFSILKFAVICEVTKFAFSCKVKVI